MSNVFALLTSVKKWTTQGAYSLNLLQFIQLQGTLQSSVTTEMYKEQTEHFVIYSTAFCSTI